MSYIDQVYQQILAARGLPQTQAQKVAAYQTGLPMYGSYSTPQGSPYANMPYGFNAPSAAQYNAGQPGYGGVTQTSQIPKPATPDNGLFSMVGGSNGQPAPIPMSLPQQQGGGLGSMAPPQIPGNRTAMGPGATPAAFRQMPQANIQALPNRFNPSPMPSPYMGLDQATQRVMQQQTGSSPTLWNSIFGDHPQFGLPSQGFKSPTATTPPASGGGTSTPAGSAVGAPMPSPSSPDYQQWLINNVYGQAGTP